MTGSITKTGKAAGIMKIAILPNLNKEEAKACLEEVLAVLKNCQVVVKDFFFRQNKAYRFENDPELSECDLFIAIGGDGTIIHMAKAAAFFGKPLLGVNAGNLGFNAGIERKDLPLLPSLLKKEFRLERRHLIQAEIFSKSGEVRRFLALNDAVISGELSKIIDYKMAVGKEGPWYRYRADGLILATPTGSTAYSLSAGGPVIEPGMDCMVYTPICPHSLFDRSVIFSSGTVLAVEILENPGKLLLTVDGEEPVTLVLGDRLNFSIAEPTVSFLKLDHKSFYEVLNAKMIRGMR